MKKIFSIFAAMLVALVANAAVININTGTSDALRKALSGAASGDVIVMAAGTYEESNSDYIPFYGKDVTVMAAEGADVIVVPKVPIRLKEGGRATFINVKFDCGHLSDMGSYSEIIVPSDGSTGKKLVLDGCEFYGWTQKSNAIIHTRSDRQIDSIAINNCYFHDNLYSCILLKYASIAGVSITNSTFANITTDANGPDAGVVDIRSTTGSVRIDHCTFYNAQAKTTDLGAIGKISTADAVVSNCVFAMPESTDNMRAIHMEAGEAQNCLTFNYLYDDGTGIRSAVTKTNCIFGQDPLFVDAPNGDLRVQGGSPVLGAGTDGSDLGDPRWIPTMNYYLVGFMNEWAVDPKYKLEKNPANEAEYMLHLTLHMGDELKVVKSDGLTISEWYPGGADNNYRVNASGDYTVYFRPDGQGGEGWHEGYIYVQAADLGPWEKLFFLPSGAEDFDSYATYDATTGKLTVCINNYKSGQWQAQVKYHGPQAEDGKCYHVALKMKANHDISGVTLKWQDDNNDPNLIYENQTINLGENTVYEFDEVVAGKAGNGILVLDFGFAIYEDTIEIYDVLIEETDCPDPEVYYLVGSMNEWAAIPEYLFTENTQAAGEYILATKLAEGDELKVVGVSGDKENYYPAGLGNAYVVDAAHAGWVNIYFRPAGNAEWAEFGGFMYIEVRLGIDNVKTTLPTTKTLEEGRLVIIKNGVRYSAQGSRL